MVHGWLQRPFGPIGKITINRALPGRQEGGWHSDAAAAQLHTAIRAGKLAGYVILRFARHEDVPAHGDRRASRALEIESLSRVLLELARRDIPAELVLRQGGSPECREQEQADEEESCHEVQLSSGGGAK